MSHLGFRSLCCALSLVFVSAPLVTGCSEANQQESVDDIGSVGVALTSTGADGAIYGFQPGSYLYVANSGSYGEYIQLDGAGTQVTRTLPVGSYTATLFFPGDGSPVLTRTEAMVTTTVDATFTNPPPVAFSIVKGQTTPLALHFSVDGLADLVFDTGTLQIIADVVEQEVNQPANVQFTGAANLFSQVNADDSAAYASALAVDLNVDQTLSLGVQLTGPWTQYGYGAVCQQATLAQATAPTSGGLARRLLEIVGGEGSLCVTDYGANDYVSFYPARFAAAPVEQSAFLPDANYSFYGGVSGYVGDVYDGTTLQQTQLQNAALTNGYFSHYVYDLTQQLTTVQGTFSGTVTFAP